MGGGGEKRGRFRIERVIGLAKIEVVGVGGGQQKGGDIRALAGKGG